MRQPWQKPPKQIQPQYKIGQIVKTYTNSSLFEIVKIRAYPPRYEHNWKTKIEKYEYRIKFIGFDSHIIVYEHEINPKLTDDDKVQLL